MAPHTRAAKARAAAAAEATCLLLDLSHDEVSIVTHELCDPLRPLLAVHLSSTAKGLWVPVPQHRPQRQHRDQETQGLGWRLEIDEGSGRPRLAGGAPGC